MTEKLQLLVRSVEQKTRLDTYLASECSQITGHEFTRSQVSQLIKLGHVQVLGCKAAKPGLEIKIGMQITVELPMPSEHLKAYAYSLDILHQDEHCVVINKPPGISMHPGAGNNSKTILNAFLPLISDPVNMFPSGTRPGIVHRIDKNTSGLVVLARTAKAHASLTKQFSERSIIRSYQALVATTPRARRVIQRDESGKIETLIGRDPNNRKKQAVVKTNGKQAITNWQVLERFYFGCLLDVKILTGRTHQIRVHMSYIDCPIVGDPVYGNFEFLPIELQRKSKSFARQALHAYKLGFVHPQTGQLMQFETKLPNDMQEIINQFRTTKST